MKRKPIRLTPTSYAVLALLSHFGEATPYDLKQALDKSIENFWQVPHTTAYEEPARLAEGGYLSSHQEAGGRRRKVYALTDMGREALRAWADQPDVAPPQLRDEALLKIFAGADPGPILVTRRAWHAAKLAELLGYLDAVREQSAGIGAERTLIAGTAYHRMMLEVLDALEAARED
jgi:PadR family transcriptional regulator, regulatory protein AphA